MKLKNLIKWFKKEKKQTLKKNGVPESWKNRKPEKTMKVMLPLEASQKRKFRVPGLKLFNQILAGILIVLNFFISQAALTSASPEVSLMFFANTWICIWGLWKSRGEKKRLE